jgi:DNA-binding MarR family transcriptional regulator
VSNGGNYTDDELATSWGLVYTNVERAQRRLLEKIEEFDIPGQWFIVLQRLLKAEDHRLPMSHIARDLSMSGGGFTKLADRMATEGLIDRRSSVGDRRVVYAGLTELGLAKAQHASMIYAAAIHESLLPAIGADQLIELAKLTSTFAEFGAEAAGPDVTELAGESVATQRDPALPDRRRRGRD